jgi:hypothetical protein
MKKRQASQVLGSGCSRRVPPGTFSGGDAVPPGTFHGGDSVPPGTFH